MTDQKVNVPVTDAEAGNDVPDVNMEKVFSYRARDLRVFFRSLLARFSYVSNTSTSTFFLTKGVNFPLNVVARTIASSTKWYASYLPIFLGLL